ncbi:signal peptidase I [Sediminihabitans luteus]|uniref:signal peptidase I n=1 Tax=Sediminihabitans luteus TaxID=1138585 RepID=UPI0012FE7D4B|nr:signal peptidase I [Sediminihabitans luteus]
MSDTTRPSANEPTGPQPTVSHDAVTPKTTSQNAASQEAVSRSTVTGPGPLDPTDDVRGGPAGAGDPDGAGDGVSDAAARGSGAQAASFLREVAIVVLAALVLSWLIKTFLVQAFYIPSQSMEDTLQKDDRVMVSRLVPGVFDVHRGDVVVFRDSADWLTQRPTAEPGPLRRALVWVGLLPQDSDEHLIKRVIGTPGDHVTCCTAEGKVSVNGVAIDEPYLKPGSVPSEIEFDRVVPDGMLFVMGDNRQDSIDSRYHENDGNGGFVPIDEVTGTAFVLVWPFDRFTWMTNPGEVFADVPAP